MSVSILRKLVRNFPENGPKLLCENPANIRDLLAILGEPAADRIDFSAMTVERTHFVKPDFAHVATDMLLKAPLRASSQGRANALFIYVLVEHQSKPERFFQLRLAEYLLEVYRMQKRAWDEKHRSDANLILNPVLPVVLYTGERAWQKLDALTDVDHEGERFREMIPSFKPHFLNLRDTPPEALVQRGGFFGQVLRLIQQRHAGQGAFAVVLQDVVSNLERMPSSERNRWTEFLSYVLALVYHSRSDGEHQTLAEVVDRSVQTDPHRKEYYKMGRTIAEMFVDRGRTEGERKGRMEGESKGEIRGSLEKGREMLMRLLRKRFKKVPRPIEARIAATNDIRTLDAWFEKSLDAASLADVGIA